MHLDDARALAEALMAEHGLHGWRLVVDRARTRAGVCRPARREIGLSAVLTELHPPAQVRETVLHEIAHALVGTAAGHGPAWRAAARAIGATEERCLPPEAPRPPAPWVGTCPAGHQVRRHRRPQRVASCRLCRRGFDLAHLFHWRHHGQVVPMHPRYEAELAGARAAGSGAGPATGLTTGLTTGPLPVGAEVRLVGSHRYTGVRGHVEARGRSRYRVRTGAGLVSVPFALVEPC